MKWQVLAIVGILCSYNCLIYLIYLYDKLGKALFKEKFKFLTILFIVLICMILYIISNNLYKKSIQNQAIIDYRNGKYSLVEYFVNDKIVKQQFELTEK